MGSRNYHYLTPHPQTPHPWTPKHPIARGNRRHRNLPTHTTSVRPAVVWTSVTRTRWFSGDLTIRATFLLGCLPTEIFQGLCSWGPPYSEECHLPKRSASVGARERERETDISLSLYIYIYIYAHTWTQYIERCLEKNLQDRSRETDPTLVTYSTV